MEQLVARWAHNPKVTGSSPVLATIQKANTLFISMLAFFDMIFVNRLVNYLVHSDQGITKGNTNTQIKKNMAIPVG